MPVSHLFRLSKVKPHNQSKGGIRIRATKKIFPALSGMSLYRLILYPNGIREPHWHANADELGYCLKGQVLVSFYATGNVRERFLVNPGEAFFIPSGSLHSIENTSEKTSELILQFSHEEPEDFGISSSFGMFSDSVLGNTWGVPSSTFKKMKRSTKDVFAILRTDAVEIHEEAKYSSPYHFNLEAFPPLVANEGGSAKTARKDVWPILRQQALYSLRLTDEGMREPHWHPETAEMGYVSQGKGRMSIMSPDCSIDTYEMEEGDVYFIPKAYPHHIENLGHGDLRILIFFDTPMPEDIGFTASVRSFDPILGSVLNVPTQFFKNIPKAYEDLFIVKKINKLDS